MPDGSWWKLSRQKEYLTVSGAPLYVRHFVALMRGLGFGQSSQCPRRLHPCKCSTVAGSGLLLSFCPGAERGQKASPSTLCLQVQHCLKALTSSSLPSVWRRHARLTSRLRFAQWSSFLYLFSSLSLPLSMAFMFGKQVQISPVEFFNITVIIAYTANYTKSDIMEVIY